MYISWAEGGGIIQPNSKILYYTLPIIMLYKMNVLLFLSH